MTKFSTPSGNNLSWIDSWLQNSKHERAWERSGVPDIFYRNTDGGDWDDIEKENNKEFMRAWHKTMSFLLERDLDINEIDFEDF